MFRYTVPIHSQQRRNRTRDSFSSVERGKGLKIEGYRIEADRSLGSRRRDSP